MNIQELQWIYCSVQKSSNKHGHVIQSVKISIKQISDNVLKRFNTQQMESDVKGLQNYKKQKMPNSENGEDGAMYVKHVDAIKEDLHSQEQCSIIPELLWLIIWTCYGIMQ